MVRVQAPAMSLEASGSLAGALVFSRWKGRPYVRELVKPSNPRTGPQVGIRAMLRFLSQDWENIGAVPQDSWSDRANAKVISNFNAYIGYNVYRWRDFLGPSDTDPPAATDVQPTLGVLAATAGVRSITVTQPITVAADGWGIAFFRSPTGVFVSTFDKLKYIGKIDGVNDVNFVDSPLDPGTYYYEVRSFTKDGQLGAASTEVDATVT
jgi:hypothetical protein